MYLATDWEMFYTDSQDDDEYVDQISIDIKNKRFILDIDVSDLATDGYDDMDNPICSTYVNREIFDIIVAGVKEKNYIEYIACE